MSRFNDLFSAISSIALAGLPLVAIAGVAYLQALLPAAGLESGPRLRQIHHALRGFLYPHTP